MFQSQPGKLLFWKDNPLLEGECQPVKVETE